MNTNPQTVEKNRNLPTQTSGKEHTIEIADGYIAKTGDTVMDFDVLSEEMIEGELRFSVFKWLVKWTDGIETIVLDPKSLRIKK